MDEYIRQLPHDTEQFAKAWPKIFDQLHVLSINIPPADRVIFKVKSLDALVDYVLADREEVDHTKISLLDVTMRKLTDEPLPSLEEFVRIFCRVLEVPDTNDLYNVTFLRKFYYQFSLGERVAALPSVILIESIIGCIEKHSFFDRNFKNQMQEKWKEFLARSLFSPLTSDRNKINSEDTMTHMRSQFQQLFRWAARYSQESNVWSEINYSLLRVCPTLFDSFTDSNDSQLNLNACVEPPISMNYVESMAKYYKTHPDAFQADINQILTAIEKLVIQDNLKAAEHLIDKAIIPHFNLITNHEELLQIFIRLCSLVQSESRTYFCKYLIAPLAYELTKKKCPKKLAGLLFDFLLAIMNLHIMQAPNCAYRLLNISEFYSWKQLDKQLTHLIQLCVSYDMITDESGKEPDNLTSILKLIQQRAKTNITILQATHEVALQAILKWASIVDETTGKPYHNHAFAMGDVMTELVDQQKITADLCIRFIDILQKRIENNDESPSISSADNHFLSRIANLLAESMKTLPTRPILLHEKNAAFCLAAFDCPFRMESGVPTFAQLTTTYLWFTVIVNLQNEEEVHPYEICADRLYQLVYDQGEQSFHPWWMTFWSIVATKYPNIAAEHIPQLLADAIDHQNFTLSSLLPTLYPKRPEPFHTRLDDIIHALFNSNSQHFMSLISLFGAIAKTHPELITSAHIDYIFTSMKNHPNTYKELNHIFHFFESIVTNQPHLFDNHRDEFLRLITEEQSLPVFICFQQYLVATAILHGEKMAGENLTLLIHFLQTIPKISADLSGQIFHTCQLIGLRYKSILATKRNDFLPFESNPACRTLIDLIDGNKISEENQAIMNRTLDEMTQIEQRVGHTERNVENITKIVKRQELNITNLDNRVDNVDLRVNDVIEQVEYQAREIERIDGKTLSYVPSQWGREVCTLLNIRAENDWRLLGKRFGYSTSELKHWTMQIDPSMSLLNEWFMTHKADEATYGLVTMLKEIGRDDVEQIIRQSVAEAGELIPDDLPMEIKRCPPVFLSYQWGSQQAVLKLKHHLEQAGYACWMDIGQMGGGDKLFAKIDAGIRGAKVVICCINKDYAQSDNCSREVHLTISTGKALIPLQMEKQTWPPEGALGPIMSEYLFIRFYDRKANDPNASWPAERFMELLGQIRYHVAPDPDLITEQYHNWFVPRIDKLIFLQPSSSSTTTNGSTAATSITNDTPLVVTHPQIMISYQWDYQTDIVKLYEKLTRLGYCCWLDIFQMGGGDSLFEKIDTGIRHSKCVLACVTPKYTKSINCRREIALADALKKPIVPLYLEETDAWPPAGPMAMVFAEKSYIDFRRSDDIHSRWSGKEFELVLARLKQAIPEVQTENPQRRLLDMQRPTSAVKEEEKKIKRISSAPVTTQSRACSIM